MAMNQNVQEAFNKLEKDTSVQEKLLDGTEKSALQGLRVEDIKSSKEDLGKEKFKINGQDFSLKWIAEHYDTTTNSLHLKSGNFVIGKGTDLAAAIQVYLLSAGYSIALNNSGATANEAKGIDGIIGTKTKSSIQDYQRDIQSNIDQTEKEKKGTPLGRKEIPNYVFTEDANSIKSGLFNEYVGKGIFSSDGYLKHTISEAEWTARKFSITYTGRNNVSKTVDIPLNVNSANKVDSKELVKSIKKAIDDKENKDLIDAQNKTIKDGINKYPETSITNKVVQKYFKDKKVNFEVTRIDGDKVTIKNKNGNSSRIERTITRSGLLKRDGTFDSGNFASKLVNIYEQRAIKYVKGDLENSSRDAQMADLKDDKIKRYQAVIDAIDSYGDSYQKEFKNERDNAVNQRNYRTSVKKVENASSKIDGTDNKTVQENALKTVVHVEDKTINGVPTHEVNYNGYTRKTYEKVGKKDEYTNKISAMVKKVYGGFCVEINK